MNQRESLLTHKSFQKGNKNIRDFLQNGSTGMVLHRLLNSSQDNLVWIPMFHTRLRTMSKFTEHQFLLWNMAMAIPRLFYWFLVGLIGKLANTLKTKQSYLKCQLFLMVLDFLKILLDNWGSLSWAFLHSTMKTNSLLISPSSNYFSSLLPIILIKGETPFLPFSYWI